MKGNYANTPRHKYSRATVISHHPNVAVASCRQWSASTARRCPLLIHPRACVARHRPIVLIVVYIKISSSWTRTRNPLTMTARPLYQITRLFEMWESTIASIITMPISGNGRVKKLAAMNTWKGSFLTCIRLEQELEMNHGVNGRSFFGAWPTIGPSAQFVFIGCMGYGAEPLTF